VKPEVKKVEVVRKVEEVKELPKRRESSRK
jgi:hypothetical protein